MGRLDKKMNKWKPRPCADICGFRALGGGGGGVGKRWILESPATMSILGCLCKVLG